MLFDILLMSKRVDLYVGEIAAVFTPNTVKFIVTVGQADSVWASMKMVIMVLGVWCGGVGRIIGTVVLLPGTVIGVLGTVIGVLGTVFRKLKIGLSSPAMVIGLARATLGLLFLPFYLFAFYFSPLRAAAGRFNTFIAVV